MEYLFTIGIGKGVDGNYNPLSIVGTDVVEATVNVASNPASIAVFYAACESVDYITSAFKLKKFVNNT